MATKTLAQLPLKRIYIDGCPVYLVGEHFSVMRGDGLQWDVRRVALNGSPFGELLNHFPTRRQAAEHARLVAKNEGKGP